jgi:glycosyltransferase involved in cell wall biosynthesis
LNKVIVINATASDGGGALSILKQFIDSIPYDDFHYLIFIYNKLNLNVNQKNISIIKIDAKSFLKRFLWDAFRLNRWIKKSKFIAIATISLQNTNFYISKSVPNFVYYHQPVPLFNYKWNPFKKGESLLWFYKNIYPCFVKLFINKKTEFFVQLYFIKDNFSKTFNVQKDKIHVISPNIEIPTQSDENNCLDKNKFNLFYPSAVYNYKNHLIILKALKILEEDIQKKIILNLTCDREDFKFYLNEPTLFKINFLGRITFNETLKIYKHSNALLFPSFIESFGLPLVEAASFGLPIIASDLPYAHEVLHNYEGVHFAPPNNERIWAIEISRILLLNGLKYKPIKFEKSNSWQELFRIVKSKI